MEDTQFQSSPRDDDRSSGWNSLHESIRARNANLAEPVSDADATADDLLAAAADYQDGELWNPPSATKNRSIGINVVLDWLVWTLATAIPVFSAVAWITIAFRRRRWGFVYEALNAACWPLVANLILTVLAVFVSVGSLLLFYQHGYDELYRIHASELIQYHEDYAWTGTSKQLGDEGAIEYELRQLNGSSHLFDNIPVIATQLLALLLPAMWLASIVHAQRQWFTDFRRPESMSDPPDKLFISAFALWLLFGWTGAHRFYLGRWISGLFYLFSFGGLGIGWAMDLFGLRAAVDKANTKSWTVTSRAPWANETRYGVFDFAARFVFFAVAPGVFVVLCVVSGHYELLLVLLFTLIVCGLFGDVQRSLQSFVWLRRLPFTRPATQVAQQLYEFYSIHQPRSFWFYLFAPITAPAVWLSSGKFREEARLFGQFLATIVAAVMINQFRQVLTTYQYHSPLNIAYIMMLHLVIATAVAAAMLTPILTTTYTYNLSGRVRRLRVLSISALVVTCGCGLFAVGFTVIDKQPSWLSYKLIAHRLTDKQFQDQLTQSSKLFLEHYVERTPKPLDAMYPLAYHPPLTKHYQDEVLGSLTSGNEAKVFRVFTMDAEGDDPDGAWIGVGMVQRDNVEAGWRTLFLMSPRHDFYSAWDPDLPPGVREDFETASALWNRQYDHRLARRNPSRDEQLYTATEGGLRELMSQMPKAPEAWEQRAKFIQFPKGTGHGLAEAVVGRFGLRAVFDPAATKQLRQRLYAEFAEETLQFRVYLIPPIEESKRWWLGVMDGDQPLCVMAPWGDYFREWDAEVFAPYRHVVAQRNQLIAAHERPSTTALFEDLRRSRARDFLNYYVHHSYAAEDLNSRLAPFLVHPDAQEGWEVKEHFVNEDEDERWLTITAGGLPQYAISPQRRFFFRQRGRMEDIAGRELTPRHAPPRPEAIDPSYRRPSMARRLQLRR